MQTALRLLYVEWCIRVKHPKRDFELSFIHKGAEFHITIEAKKPSLIVTSESIIHLGKQKTFQGQK